MFSCARNTKNNSLDNKPIQKIVIISNTKYENINVYRIKNFKSNLYDTIKNEKKERYTLGINDKLLVTNLNLRINNIQDFIKPEKISNYDSAVLIKFEKDQTIITDLLYVDETLKKNYSIDNLNLDINLCNICMEEFSINYAKDIFNCKCCPIICEICATKLECCPYCRKQI